MADNTGSGGVFTFDTTRFTVMCAYRSPVPEYIWILYVQACEGKDPIVKTAFCPEPRDFDSIFKNVFNRGLWGYDDFLPFPDPEGPTMYLATCRAWTAKETEPGKALTVEFKLWEVNPSKSPSESTSERPADASIPRRPFSVIPSKVSISVVNKTRSDITPHPGVAWATIPDSRNIAPPENVAAGTTGSGGMFSFHPSLCAISAYVTPHPSYIWVLFVRASSRNGIVAKTAFYHEEKGIDQNTVIDIDGSAAIQDTAMHAFIAMGLDAAFLATCQVGDAEETESGVVLSVHFELTAIPQRTAESASNAPTRLY